MANEKPPHTPTHLIAPFGLRMQPALRDALMDSAKASGRSLNSEIVHRLTESLSKEPRYKRAREEEAAKLREEAARARRELEGLNTSERLAIDLLRKLPAESRMGLLTFLQGIAGRLKGARK